MGFLECVRAYVQVCIITHSWPMQMESGNLCGHKFSMMNARRNETSVIATNSDLLYNVHLHLLAGPMAGWLVGC